LSDRYYLFKGCLIPTRVPHLEKASLIALDSMGVDHVPLPGATCCVEPIGLRSMAKDTWLVTVARMLAIAETDGRDVLTLCNGCYLSFQEARHALQEPAVRDRVNLILSSLGREYRGGVKVRHLLDLAHDKGEESMKSLVRRDLSAFKLAPHSGCHVLRPSKADLRERAYAPRMLGDVARWLGSRVVSEEGWPECCGGGVASVDDGVSIGILEDVCSSYRRSGATCILTPCPFCFSQFDLRQKGGLPVLHLS
jgi:heterodisulfide reductase subunit B